MGTEERDFGAVFNGIATSAQINGLQDHWVHGCELANYSHVGLGPTSELMGGTQYFGIYQCNNGAVTIIDAQRDWRQRILDVAYDQVPALAQLPKGANYDPAAVAAADFNIMYMGAGATPAVPPVGLSWNFRANLWIYAANAPAGPVVAGDLCVTNNTGAAVFLLLWILQTQDVG